jgi:hypothetical protein
LRAAARTRLTALDLRQEDWLSQNMMRGGQHGLQAADLLHRRIEVQQGMPPIDPAGSTRPHLRRQRTDLEGLAKPPDPGRGNSAAQQQIALVVEKPRLFGVEPTDPGARQKFRHGSWRILWSGSGTISHVVYCNLGLQFGEPLVVRNMKAACRH